MRNIVLFGGTTEGKLLVEFMEEQKIACYVCVATEYGREVLPPRLKYCKVLAGRLSQGGMGELFREKLIRLVLDATHPYAVEVSENIARACAERDLRCIRVGREIPPEVEGAVYVSSVQEAADYLNRKRGNALLTTGSKDLGAFRSVADYRNRLYARILPVGQVIEKANGYGFSGEHLICGRGPFSVGQNMKMIRSSRAETLVTKDTGKEGGFPEKAEAARRAGIELLVIRRPRGEQGMTVGEAQEFLRHWG